MSQARRQRPARWALRILLGASLVLALLLGAGFIMRPAPIPSAVIARSVTQTEVLLERAWQLPVAASYKRRVVFQSNGSVCGPATLANVFRSLGDATDSEAEVLAGSGRCWSGLCIPGLTLDQVAEVARLHTRRRVTVLR